MMKLLVVLANAGLLLISSLRAADSVPSGPAQAEHVVLVVWDGMRPDFVSPQFTPNLNQLAVDGVFFKNHHPVYVSSTEVNGTAIATGAYPDHSGVIANRDYRPEVGWTDSLGTESIEAVRRGDVLTGGHYLAVPTMAELLQAAGLPTVVAGTKPVALLQDRSNRRVSTPALESVTLYNGHTIPSDLLEAIVKAQNKAFPASATPNVARDEWTTKALTGTLWERGVPKFSLLWLSEPDASQHASAPGSDTAVAAMESCDNNLGLVLKALDHKKIRDKTDVIVVSDHGFSSIQRGVDVADILRKARFKAAKSFDDPEPGNVLVVGLGGSVMLYVIDHDETVVRKLVRLLQGSDFAAVIFSRVAMEGTFPIDQARLGTAKTSPDVIVAMRWTNESNDFGAPGMLIADTGKRGSGTHGSLSRFDMHNTMVASGPDFRQSFVDQLPSGNADVAPTVLYLLGVMPPNTMDGRVLREALRKGSEPAQKPEPTTLKASCDVGLRHWEQYLKFTKFGEQVYFDEGNGESKLR
jgi:arylsulfatase A-like enzyme